MDTRSAGFPARAVIGASLITAIANLPAYLTGALSIAMRPDLRFSTAGTGIAVSAFMGASALAGPVLGPWVQRLGSARAIQVAAGVIAASFLGIATLTSDWTALVAMLVVGGIGNSMGQMASNMLLSEGGSRAHDGMAFGVKQAAVPFATMFAGLSVPVFVGVVGWRSAFALAAVLSVAVAVPARWYVGGRPERAPDGRSNKAVRGRVDWLVVGVCTGAAFFGSGVSIAAAVFLVDFAVASDWSHDAAGVLLAVCSGVGVIARVAVGWMFDRRTRRGHDVFALLPASMIIAIGALGLLLLIPGSGSPVLLAVGGVLGVGVGWGWPGLMHLTVVSLHRDSVAVATGTILFGVFAGGVAMPVMLGNVAERVSYQAGWAVSAALLLLASAGFALLHWSYRRRPAPGANRY